MHPRFGRLVFIPLSVMALQCRFPALFGFISFQLMFVSATVRFNVRSYPPVLSLALPSSSLTPPPTNSTPKFIAIAAGMQNYTCQGNIANNTPHPLGPSVQLYSGGQNWTQQNLHTIPFTTMYWEQGAIFPNPLDGLTNIGRYYYNEESKHMFDLPSISDVPLAFQINETAPAPANAFRGTNGEPATHWIMYTSFDSFSNVSRRIYAVETVGGETLDKCGSTKEEPITAAYTALFWLYI